MQSNIVTHSIKNEIKENLLVSVPLIASQLVASFSQFLGTAMVAHLGPDPLAAGIVVGMLWATISFSFIGVLNAISVLVSHQHGAGNRSVITEIMGQGFFLSIIMSFILAIALIFLPYLIRITGQPESVLALSDQYAHSLIWTIPGLMLIMVCEQFLIGISRTKLVLRVTLLIVPLEIFMLYILINGKLGFPALGLAGTGYGFAVSYTLTGSILAIYLFKSRFYRDYQIFSQILRPNLIYLKELLRIGVPMGLMHIIEIGAFAVGTFWIAHFGTIQAAAHQIAIQFLGFIITFIFGMSQTVTVRVGQYVGRLDLTGVKYAIFTGMGLSFSLMAIVAMAFIFVPELFIQIDLNLYDPANEALIKNAATLLALCGVLMLFDNFRIIAFGSLRGIKDTNFPMIASIVSFWLVGLSLAYWFGFTINREDVGIWWGLTAGVAAGAIILMVRLKLQLKKVDLEKVLKVTS